MKKYTKKILSISFALLLLCSCGNKEILYAPKSTDVEDIMAYYDHIDEELNAIYGPVTYDKYLYYGLDTDEQSTIATFEQLKDGSIVELGWTSMSDNMKCYIVTKNVNNDSIMLMMTDGSASKLMFYDYNSSGKINKMYYEIKDTSPGLYLLEDLKNANYTYYDAFDNNGKVIEKDIPL